MLESMCEDLGNNARGKRVWGAGFYSRTAWNSSRVPKTVFNRNR
jgi:hypothetical protein